MILPQSEDVFKGDGESGEFLKADNLTTKDTKTNETATSCSLRALCGYRPLPNPPQHKPIQCQQQFFAIGIRPRLVAFGTDALLRQVRKRPSLVCW